MDRDLSGSRAILIGNSTYRDPGIPDIPGAALGVQAMSDLLTGDLCGWPTDCIQKLVDVASPSELARRILAVIRDADSTGVLLLYYVGHGQRTTDGQLALTVGDTDLDPRALPHTAILYDAIAKILRGCQAATKLVILDCCHAELGTKANYQFLSADLAEAYPVDGLYFIGASRTHEKAKASLTPGLTYFTRAFIDVVQTGIPGKPPVLKLDQIFVELRSRMLRASLPEPVESGIRGAHQVPFARNAAPPQTHVDLEGELRRLQERLAALERARDMPTPPGDELTSASGSHGRSPDEADLRSEALPRVEPSAVPGRAEHAPEPLLSDRDELSGSVAPGGNAEREAREEAEEGRGIKRDAAADQFTYQDFDLLIERSARGSYQARVLRSPAGEGAPVEFTPPLSPLDLENLVLKGARSRRGGPGRTDSAPLKEFGGKLYGAVFQDDTRDLWQRSLSLTRAQQVGLRLRLRLADSAELSALPWEFLYDPRHNHFLAQSRHTQLVRYLDLPDPPHPLSVEGPLRLLVMISSPSDYPALDADQEFAALTHALAPQRADGQLIVERLAANMSTLRQRLRHAEFHIFHFIGHGGYRPDWGDGVMAMEDRAGRSHEVTGEELGGLLSEYDQTRLVVLNAGEGARSDTSDRFAGMAQSLIRQGLPAVVAMQFEITDDAAITFAREFYAAIADGYPLEAALAEARGAIRDDGNLTEWATPVLYSRAPDGRLFDLTGRAREQLRIEKATAARPDPGRSRAVLIGTSTYRHFEDLPAVRNNLIGFRDVLIDPALGALPPSNCTVLADSPSASDAYHTLRELAIAAEDTLLVYFAGSGRIGDRNELYLCLPDTDPDQLSFTALAYNHLRDAVAQSSAARKVIILDCSFSGRSLAEGDDKGRSPAEAAPSRPRGERRSEETTVGKGGIEGTYILTAAPANAVALAKPGERYSAFTGALLDLLHTGISGGPELLTLAAIYPALRDMLTSRQLPQPVQRASGTIDQLALTRNPAYMRR